MNSICGYNLDLWRYLGFNFPQITTVEKLHVLYGEKQFDQYIFSLTIRIETGYTLAMICNLQFQKLANHVVSEDEAVMWFSKKSKEFEICYKSFNDKEKK
jgi:hypothetical protein